MKHKYVSNLSPLQQRPNTKRYELTSVALGWLVACIISFIDYSLECYVFRFFTANYIPLLFCYLFDIVIMILGIFNVFACVFALLDFDVLSKIANPVSLNRSMHAQSAEQLDKPDKLSYVLDGLLARSTTVDQSSNNTSLTFKDYHLNRHYGGSELIRRSSTALTSDVYTDEQLLDFSEVQRADFVHKTFEPRINRSLNYKYYASEEHEPGEVDKANISQLDQSQLDLLIYSDYYEQHPEYHPLKDQKRKYISCDTFKGRKRGRRSLSPLRSHTQWHQTHNINIRSKNSSFSRSPKFLKNQKPTITSIAKLFKDDWEVSGEEYTIMMENLRKFISRQIIQPLAKEIHNLNQAFRSNNPTRNVSIGRTSLTEIEKVFGQIDEKKITNLPYVLAYLRLNQHYTHLVKRILAWAQSDSIFDYVPNATEPPLTAWPESFPRNTASLPTDGELIFQLFCHFMDTHSGLYPLTYPYPCDLPFTRLHILSENEKPSDIHLGDNGYYIEVSCAKPMSFKFHASRYPQIVTHPTSNVLLALLMLLIYGHGNEWYKILKNAVTRL